MKVEFTFRSNQTKQKEVFDYPDDTKEEVIEEDYLNWRENYLDGSWRIVEE